MNVAPGATYEAVLETGETGLVGTIVLGLVDNQGATTEALAATGIIETPAGSGVYAATRTAPTVGGQYTLIWSLDGTTNPDKVATDTLTVTTSAPLDPPPPGGTIVGYTTTGELARILQITPPPSGDQEAALIRVLTSAYVEILSEIDDPDQLQPLTANETELAAEVQLDRANEHWQQVEKPFGIIGINDAGAIYVARDSWDRHALKLAPLKRAWGLA